MRALFSLKGLTINHPTLCRSDPIPLDPRDQVFGLLYECHHFYFWFNRTYVITFFFLFGFQETGIFSTEWYLVGVILFFYKRNQVETSECYHLTVPLTYFSFLNYWVILCHSNFQSKRPVLHKLLVCQNLKRKDIKKKKKENRRCVDFLTNMKLLWWFFRPPHLYTSK